METLHNQIDQIIENFQFQRVHTAMAALNWKWLNDETSPSLKEIKEFASNQLRYAASQYAGREYQGKDFYVSSGGFRTSISKDGIMQLFFVVEEWRAD